MYWINICKMKKSILIFLFLFSLLSVDVFAQQGIRVKATYESSNGKYRPVFYIVWPNGFKGDKYDIRVHISYDIQTSDGHWYNYNDATIYGVSGKYALEWVYAYIKPITDMRIRIKSIDGLSQTASEQTQDNTSYNSGISPTYTPYYGGGGGGGLPNLTISAGYLSSKICYGPYAKMTLYLGFYEGGGHGAAMSVGYGSRGSENIWHMSIGFFHVSNNAKNEFIFDVDMSYEKTKLETERDDMRVLFGIEYTHYLFASKCLGIYIKPCIGMGGKNLKENGNL